MFFPSIFIEWEVVPCVVGKASTHLEKLTLLSRTSENLQHFGRVTLSQRLHWVPGWSTDGHRCFHLHPCVQDHTSCHTFSFFPESRVPPGGSKPIEHLLCSDVWQSMVTVFRSKNIASTFSPVVLIQHCSILHFFFCRLHLLWNFLMSCLDSIFFHESHFVLPSCISNFPSTRHALSLFSVHCLNLLTSWANASCSRCLHSSKWQSNRNHSLSMYAEL